jgi:hypothetical protein
LLGTTLSEVEGSWPDAGAHDDRRPSDLLTAGRAVWWCTDVMSAPVYKVRRAGTPPEHAGEWDGPVWGMVPKLAVAHFHPRSSDHRPRTEAALLYDDEQLHALFRVADRYVRSGGAFSLRYIEDSTRTSNRFARWVMVAPDDAATIRVAHSLPPIVEPERTEPVTWWVELSWPFAAMEPYCGPLRPVAGQRWRANAFKCGDETSHPHWASWAPIGEALNFHQPGCFGRLELTETA